jgi:D-alanyl-D-alanine carboxypeptidase
MVRSIVFLVFLAALISLLNAAPHPATAASLAVDAETGEIISADGADRLWFPASLTKMMTVYVALKEIKEGRLSFDDEIVVSEHASGQLPVKFGLGVGQHITLEQAMRAAIVASGNDAAVAVAEKVAGSEAAFAAKMTEVAHGLGMNSTRFVNASGLPDERQVTTARDMAVLAMALMRDFPENYGLFNARSVSIGSRVRPTVNSILGSYPGADGLKTGFTCGSGYNLVASALREGRRVVGVVLGSQSRAERLRAMIGLLDAAFDARAHGYGNIMEVAAMGVGAPPTVLDGSRCSSEAALSGEIGVITSSTRVAGWGIVFGAFSKKEQASAAITAARKELAPIVKGGRPAIIRRDYEGNTRYSALLVGYDQGAAAKACKHLWAKEAYCLVLSPSVINNPESPWR